MVKQFRCFIIMDRKFIFLDIDGTLVDSRGRLPVSASGALRKARENGHRIILATGRQRSQIYSWLTEEFSFDGIIASSGAYIEDGAGKIIFESRPDKEMLRYAVEFFRGSNTPYCLQTAEAVVTEQWCMKPILDLFRAYGFCDEVIDSVFKNTVVTDTPEDCMTAEKLAYYQSPLEREEVQRRLGSYFYVTGYSMSNGAAASNFGEITFEGVNKATGIQRYMEAAGAPVCNTVAIGDSENDIEMLEFAGIGVAMGNAPDVIKNAADLVTAGINEDGIEKAFTMLKII